MAASAVRRMLVKADRRPPHVFRLRMPEAARRKLSEHAEALGCAPGELAAFLFSRKSRRRQAVIRAGEGRMPA